jgi:hypothetical protein
MNLHLSRHGGGAASVVLLAGFLAACAGSVADDTAAGPGMTDLAPSYDAQPTAKARPKAHKKSAEGRRTERTGTAEEGPKRAPSAKPAKPARSRSAVPAHADPGAADPAPVRTSDPAGDLSTSLEGAPSSADVVAVQLDRAGDMVEVRTTFAGRVPTRAKGAKGMNVASFYDVDGNGIVDYEVWVSLADNGWGTGHLDRRERESSFGPSTGIEVSVQGDTLVTRFPLDRIGGVERFRWSAASEWGSYESMAASTSARDYAPDDGAVRYPG